jgi:hypothetical protein
VKGREIWGKGEKTLTYVGNVYKLVQILHKSVRRFFKKLKTELPYDPAIPTPVHISEGK